jgi:hypothetical protein
LIKKYKVYSLPLVSARFHGNICGLLVDIAVADHGKERISFFVPATQGKDQQQPEFFKSSLRYFLALIVVFRKFRL